MIVLRLYLGAVCGAASGGASALIVTLTHGAKCGAHAFCRCAGNTSVSQTQAKLGSLRHLSTSACLVIPWREWFERLGTKTSYIAPGSP